MFFEFLFVSFSSFRSSLFLFFFFRCSFSSSVFFLSEGGQKEEGPSSTFEKKHPTRKRKPNATFRQRERESREIKMVTPLVKTNKIKKKPNGFTRYQSDTAKRVSVRLFSECISTSARCVPLPAYSHGRETWRGLCSLGG